MQQYPDQARAFGLKALNRALDGVAGTVAVHLCFGYAAVVHDKPTGYSSWPSSKTQRPSRSRSRRRSPARPQGLEKPARKTSSWG